MAKKVRLDSLLVERGLVETREKAKQTIIAGLVFSQNIKMNKPGVKVDEELPLQVKGKAIPYVSRGGLKLEKAIQSFQLDVKDKILIDIGSSTGGFTDCALQNGAKKSYAIDVGYNQLDNKLRKDDRVTVMESTNFRYVTPEDLTEGTPNFASIDVSFISLKLILPVLATLLEKDGDVVALIKPQFEAGREHVGKKGIIRDPKVHKHVLQDILHFAVSKGYVVEDITYSPITGGDGNIEFLAHFRMSTTGEGMLQPNVDIEHLVKEAHNAH
ncbi:TlyA family RNA methyltransferase [Pontibacillus yanchengensis]|uniref:RNA methyltransferase n=1 Tax=Pontibacillus yanchengensis Y32 TaxID=1385514 RepID=A0A0A2T996_9BACI|nr:TlyA family RNA methyltransferase [Pontibacillus yanchengensis]KGP70978.1 RNA methyltransferase [Pontibacillus yanchengensis Y32]